MTRGVNLGLSMQVLREIERRFYPLGKRYRLTLRPHIDIQTIYLFICQYGNTDFGTLALANDEVIL